jgi:hypothetical protein
VYGDNLALIGAFAELALAPGRPRSKTARAHVRRGVDHPAGRSDRSAGNRQRRGGEPSADQRRWWRLGLLRDPARQAARWHVTGVDNAAKQEHMQSMRAEVVLDYNRDDVTRTSRPYDVNLDLVAHRSVFAARRALA